MKAIYVVSREMTSYKIFIVSARKRKHVDNALLSPYNDFIFLRKMIITLQTAIVYPRV